MSFPPNDDDARLLVNEEARAQIRSLVRIAEGEDARVDDGDTALPGSARLVVAPGAEWFQLEGQPIVHIETRVSLRKLLLALAGLRLRDADAELSVREAFAAGWPGERAHPNAASVRVYTAVHTLRGFGLRGLLIRRSGGYALDVDVRIAAAESQFPHALLVDEDSLSRAV